MIRNIVKNFNLWSLEQKPYNRQYRLLRNMINDGVVFVIEYINNIMLNLR